MADRLESAQNGQPLTFECVKREAKIEDHVRCDFVFKANWPIPPEPGQVFRFQETNYEDQKGQVDLSFAAEQGFGLDQRHEPDDSAESAAEH